MQSNFYMPLHRRESYLLCLKVGEVEHLTSISLKTGLLSNLQPGNIGLADRGFTVQDSNQSTTLHKGKEATLST